VSTHSQSADRNLLFGVLAFQADLIDSARFAEACSAWASRKDIPLADVLVERGWLSTEERGHVEFLLDRKLKKHRGDERASLAEVTTDAVRQCAAALPDAEVRASLMGATPSSPGPVLLTATTIHVPVQGERYTMSRLHATGGIGRVWLARDTSLGRDVALKEIRPERADNPVVWARFLKEAQITGQLEHPGIVPIYEVSQRPDEHPFYTMRFVRGRTLSEAVAHYHARRQRGEAGPMELRELLGNFVGVCHAVAYAHSRGVIHRDLKPTNVVLGDFGEVIVLDWGLARLLAQPEGEADLAPLELSAEDRLQETMEGQVLGTPAYMAPEQAEGRRDVIGPATDIYGLGAVLYEVLTGRPPFDGPETTSVLRRVVHEPPAPPRSIVPGTAAALQAVCLKALAKKPAERYSSASELASEIRHYLADEPVAAYADPLLVRLGRKARRHRTLVAGLAAAAIVAVISLTAATVLLSAANHREAEARALAEQHGQEAEREREQAQANFQLARDAVDEYCTKVSDDPRLKEKDLEDLRKELLQTATKFHEKFVQRRGNDPQQRADLGRAYVRLGRLTAQIGSRDRALALFRQGAAIFEELVATNADSVEYRHELASSQSTLAGWMAQTGSRVAAIASLRRATSILEKIVQDHPGESKYAVDLGGAYCDLADLIRYGGEREEGLRLFKRAIQTLEPVCQKEKENDKARRFLANSYECQGNTYRVLRRYGEGIASCLRALPLREQLVAKNPRIPLHEEDLSRTLHVLALLYESDRQPDKALDTLRQSLALVERSAANHPTVTNFRASVAIVQVNLGNTYRSMGKRAESEAAYQASLALYQDLSRRHPSVLQYRMDMSVVFLNLGVLAVGDGDSKRAARHFHTMAGILTQVEPTYPRVLELLGALTDSYLDLVTRTANSDPVEQSAEVVGDILAIRKYLAAAKPVVTAHLLDHARACANLGHVLAALKRTEDATASYEKATRTVRDVLAKDARHGQARGLLSHIYFSLANLYRQNGKNDQAEKTYSLALEIIEPLAAENPKAFGYQQTLANVQTNLAFLSQDLGKLDRALALYQQAVRVREALAREYPKRRDAAADLAASYFNLALVLETAMRLDIALEAARQAFALQEKLVAENPTSQRYQSDLARTAGRLGTLYFKNNRLDEGITAIERERDMHERLAQAHPKKTTSLARFARTQRRLGDLYVIAKKADLAVGSFTQAAIVFDQLSADPVAGKAAPYLSDLAHVFAGLGSAFTIAGKADESFGAFSRCADFIDLMPLDVPGRNSARAALVKGYTTLAQTLMTQRRSEEALEVYRRIQEPARKLLAAFPGNTQYQQYLIGAVANPGALYATTGRMDLALNAFAETILVLESMNQAGPHVIAARVTFIKNLNQMGEHFSKKAQAEPAAQAYDLAVKNMRELAAADPDNDGFSGNFVFACMKLGQQYERIGKWEQACQTYSEQLAVIRKLAKKRQDVPNFTTLHGATHHDLGHVANKVGKYEEAIAEFDQAIVLLEDALRRQKDPKLRPGAQVWLASSHGGRGLSLHRLKRNEEAAQAYDRALKLALGQRRAYFQLRLAFLQVQSGAHAVAVASAEEAVKVEKISAGNIYSAACVLSLASSAVVKDSNLAASEQKKRSEQYAQRALALLRQAKTAGYFTRAMIAHLNKDSDLDPLRHRAEYSAFVAELEGKGKAKGE
jgi:serine/threonine-protein kinase